MASGALPGPSAPTPQASEPPQPAPVPLSWEGDKMFNIYIFDYCSKRGYTKTARELVNEAEIPPGSQPPIDAKQGLLFEWWSVFWVLFQAKNNSTDSEDAILYTQRSGRSAAAPPNLRFPANMSGRPAPFPNGPMSNGVPPPGQPSLPPPAQPGYSMPTPGAQANGVHAPPPQGFQPPNPQAPRPGGGPQHRPPNGAPFQSPTMAPSPQTQGGPQASQMGPSPRMSNVARGPMPPPAGPQGGSAQHTPVFQSGRPPSRQGTPVSQNPMNPHPSPSMAPARMSQDRQNLNELSQVPQDLLKMAKVDVGLGDKDLMMAATAEERHRVLNRVRQLRQLPPPTNGMPGSNNAVAGPSGGHPPPGMRNGQPASGQPPQRGAKRNSTSPGEEHETIPRTESSPHPPKRPRRTPVPGEQQQPPPITPMNPGFPPQHPPGQPPLMHGMGRAMPFNPQMGMPGQPGMNMQMAQGMPPMQMNMSPMMAHPPPGPMNPHGMQAGHFGHPQNAAVQYRNAMLNIHQKPHFAGVPPGMMPGGSPPTNDPQAHMRGAPGPGQVGPNNRMPPKGVGGMPPPGQPGVPGLNKSPQVEGKPHGGDGGMQGGGHQMNMGQPGGMSSHPGSMPQTPASAPPGNPGMASSPAMNNQGGIDPPRPSTANGTADMFNSDLFSGLGSGFEFDPSALADFSSSVELDFWINHAADDPVAAMDGLK